MKLSAGGGGMQVIGRGVFLRELTGTIGELAKRWEAET